MKIIIIYDTPWKKCDKKWLFEKLLEKNNNVIQISPRSVLYNIETRNRIGYLYVMCVCLWMSIKAVMLAKTGDIIVGWKTLSGIFSSILAPKGVRVISLNWLTPQPNDKLFFLRKMAIRKKNIWLGINCHQTKKELVSTYSEIDNNLSERIFWIPDVPERDYTFEEIQCKHNKYCFTGGINNRDWNLLIKTAKENDDVVFKCVALEKYYRENLEENIESENVDLFFNLDNFEYYEMLKKAYIMVLPLKDQRVAGLINVIKAIEYGVLPLTSRNKAIEQYYPEELREMLQFEIGNEKELSEKIRKMYELSFEQYVKYICKLREHLLKNFNAGRAIDCIMKVIEE